MHRIAAARQALAFRVAGERFASAGRIGTVRQTLPPIVSQSGLRGWC